MKGKKTNQPASKPMTYDDAMQAFAERHHYNNFKEMLDDKIKDYKNINVAMFILFQYQLTALAIMFYHNNPSLAKGGPWRVKK